MPEQQHAFLIPNNILLNEFNTHDIALPRSHARLFIYSSPILINLTNLKETLRRNLREIPQQQVRVNLCPHMVHSVARGSTKHPTQLTGAEKQWNPMRFSDITNGCSW